MTSALILYLTLVVVLAALLVTHAALVVRLLRERELGAGTKAVGAIPPVTPFIAWNIGARVGPVVWLVLAVGYVALAIAANT